MKPPEIFKEMGLPSIQENPEWWIHEILTNLFFLSKVVLHHGKKIEYRDLNWIHKKLCDFLIKNPALQKLILMFRDSLKSSIARALMLQWFLQKAYRREEGKGFIYSGIFDLAQDHAEKIIKELLSNQIIQYLFYYLPVKGGLAPFIPHKKTDITVIALDKGKIRYNRIEIDIGSPEKSLTGHHYEIGIIDNAVNEVNSQKVEGRQKIIKRWQQGEAVLSEDAREFIFETTWWIDDLAGTILSPKGRFDFSKIKNKPAYEFTSVTGYAVFSCPARDEDGNPVFPEKTNEAYLARKKAKMGSYLYSALYDLQPVAEEDIEIKKEWIDDNHYEVDPPIFISNMIIDCAGTKAKESSYSAISIGDWNELGKLHITFAEKRKLYPMELYDWMIEIYNERAEMGRPINLIGVEKEKYGIFLHDVVRVNNPRLPIRLLDIKSIPRPTRNKSVIVHYESGNILSKKGLKDYEDEALTWYMDKQRGTDIFDTIYYHYQIKCVPKKPKEAPAFVPLIPSDFAKQVQQERASINQSMRQIARTF